MSTENNSFEYSYSPREQEEIKKIRERYKEPPERDKMTLLRELDASVTKKGSVAAIVMGIIGVLVMGSGMSFVMTDISELFGMGEGLSLICGIALGFAGIILAAAAYPTYNRITEKEKKRIAPQILALTEELMK